MDKVEKFLEYSKVDPTELGLLASRVYEEKLRKEFIQWFGEMTAAEILAISKYLLMRSFDPMPDDEPDLGVMATMAREAKTIHPKRNPKKKTRRKTKKKTKRSRKTAGGVETTAQSKMEGL